jgi:hypothetical protein
VFRDNLARNPESLIQQKTSSLAEAFMNVRSQIDRYKVVSVGLGNRDATLLLSVLKME